MERFVRAAALDLPRGLRINVVSPPFRNETAAQMGMPDKGQISAADSARAYVSLVEENATGSVVLPEVVASGRRRPGAPPSGSSLP